MEYLILVTVRCAFEELIHKTADSQWIKGASVAVLIHIFFQILFAIFENQDKFRLGVYNVMEANDVDVLEFLHERDFANRR